MKTAMTLPFVFCNPRARNNVSRRVTLSSLLLTVLIYLSGCTAVQESTSAFKRIAPEGLADSQNLWNYSQVIAVEPGTQLIEIAGSTGDDENGNMVAPNDFAKQVERTFANVETSLHAAGATGADVVRVRMYVVGLDGEAHWPVINTEMRKLFGEKGPAATLVGVQALAMPDILFEMDASAVVAHSAK